MQFGMKAMRFLACWKAVVLRVSGLGVGFWSLKLWESQKVKLMYRVIIQMTTRFLNANRDERTECVAQVVAKLLPIRPE